MKTTIEIADDLLSAPNELPEKRRPPSFTDGARLAFGAKQKQEQAAKLPPLVTVRGSGLSAEFKDASWDKIRMRSTGARRVIAVDTNCLFTHTVKTATFTRSKRNPRLLRHPSTAWPLPGLASTSSSPSATHPGIYKPASSPQQPGFVDSLTASRNCNFYRKARVILRTPRNRNYGKIKRRANTRCASRCTLLHHGVSELWSADATSPRFAIAVRNH